MHVNGHVKAFTVMPTRMLEPLVTRTLPIALVKCGVGKNHTFLITAMASTVVTVSFFCLALGTKRIRCSAKHCQSAVTHGTAVDPLLDGHILHTIFVGFRVGVNSMAGCATEPITAVPIDMQFIPRTVAKYGLVGHDQAVKLAT